MHFNKWGILICIFILELSCSSQGLEVVDQYEGSVEMQEFLQNLYNAAVKTSFFTTQIENINTEENRDGVVLTKEVLTSSGKLQGIVREEASCFYNVPFAEPPIDELRFKPPVPIDSPSESLDVSENKGWKCFQPHELCDVNIDINGTGISGSQCEFLSEDCLFLNVHVPRDVDLSDTGKIDAKPVMVFLHGGAFFIGSSNLDLYKGRWMANVTNTIIVTLNYRLGPLGFLHFDDGVNQISGNLGLDDQRLGLQWVNDNIGKFGGDPNQITLFGESAGAQSVMMHMLSDRSKELFQTAIMQSNPASYPYPTPDEAIAMTNIALQFLNCADGDEYNCLMTAPAENLIATIPLVMAASRADLYDLIEPFRPVIDGIDFDQQPLEAFKEGAWQSDKEFILGTNTEEADLFYQFNPLPIPLLTEELYTQLNNLVFGDEIGTAVTEYYIDNYGGGIRPNYGSLFFLEMTHVFFTCPTRTLARFAADTTTKADGVYLYYNDHPREDGTCDSSYLYQAVCGSSFHGSELIYVFQNGQHIGFNYSEDDYAVASHFGNYWGSFAHNSDPSAYTNDDTIAEWPSHASDNLQSIFIQSPVSEVKEDHMQEDCDFWESLDYYIDLSDTSSSSSTPPSTSSAPPPDPTTEEPSTLGMDETTSSALKMSYKSVILFSMQFLIWLC